MLPEHAPDLSAFSEPGLFSLYRAILRELKGRGVIRTENAPVGDYAEYLVATALGGQLAPNSSTPSTITFIARTGRSAKARPPGVIIRPLRTRMSGSCGGTGSAA